MPSKQLTLQPTINVDLDSLEFDLPKGLDNLQSLELFEQQVLIAYQDVESAWDSVSEAYTRAAYHIHMILEHRLWRHRQTTDENGLTYQLWNFQEDYLEDLANNTLRGFKKSTVLQFHATIRMYREMGWSRKDIEAATIRVLNKVARKVEKNYLTGAPEKLRDGNVPEDTTLIDYINATTVEVLENIRNPDMPFNSHDLDLHLDRRLANRKPMIDFRKLDRRDLTKLQWVYELYDDVGLLTPSRYGTVQIIFNDDPPEEVKVRFYAKLGIELE